jgi:hypothetical protein
VPPPPHTHTLTHTLTVPEEGREEKCASKADAVRCCTALAQGAHVNPGEAGWPLGGVLLAAKASADSGAGARGRAGTRMQRRAGGGVCVCGGGGAIRPNWHVTPSPSISTENLKQYFRQLREATVPRLCDKIFAEAVGPANKHWLAFQSASRWGKSSREDPGTGGEAFRCYSLV